MKLFLNGGGAGKAFKEPFDILNSLINNDKPVLYIPLAMNQEDHPYDACLEWFNYQLQNIEIPYVDMARSFDELSSKDLNEYSFIFIGGGNTYKLLKGLKETNAYNKITNYLKDGGIVFGGSAGAVIFGKDINIISQMDKNDVNLSDTSGFDMINGLSIFPHYTNKKSKLSDEENQERLNNFTNSIIEFSKKVGKVYALPEEDTLIYNDGDIKIIGDLPYYTCEDGMLIKHDIKDKKRTIK